MVISLRDTLVLHLWALCSSLFNNFSSGAWKLLGWQEVYTANNHVWTELLDEESCLNFILIIYVYAAQVISSVTNIPSVHESRASALLSREQQACQC